MSTTATRLTSRASPQDLRISGAEKIFLIIICALYLVVAIRSAYLRPFWFDELSTLFISSTPTLREMFHAIPTDGNPPLYFLLARPFLHLPIRTELALRLPAVFAYLFAAWTIYCFVRRDTSRVFASLAMGMFLASFSHGYAIEARAYSLLMAFTGLTLCCWQAYCYSRKSVYLCGVSAGILGAIFSHNYGVIYALLPLFVGEAVRSIRRRAIDPLLICVAGVSVPALLTTIPPTLQGQRILLKAIRDCPNFLASPHLSHLKIYATMVPPLFLPLILLAVLALLLKLAASKSQDAQNATSHIPIEHMAVAVTLSLFLPLMLIVTHFGTKFFQPRYGLGSAMGLSMLAGFLLSRMNWRHARQLAWTAAVYSFAVGFLTLWLRAIPRTTLPWSDPVLYSGNSIEPIVIANPLNFSSTWWYSSNAMRGRLHYLEDLNYATQYSNVVPEFSLALEHDYTPMQLDDYHSFLNQHQHFLLYCSGDPRLEWIKQRLPNEGWHLTPLRSAKLEPPGEEGQFYRELYEVTR